MKIKLKSVKPKRSKSKLTKIRSKTKMFEAKQKYYETKGSARTARFNSKKSSAKYNSAKAASERKIIATKAKRDTAIAGITAISGAVTGSTALQAEADKVTAKMYSDVLKLNSHSED